MIDWLNLFYNSIWIIALAVALAVLSNAYYESRLEGVKLGVILNTSRFVLPLNIAGALFSLGMALTSERWWEILLWIVMMGLIGYQGYLKIKYKI